MAGTKPVIAVPASIQSFQPKADRSWKLVFETRELTGDEVNVLVENYQGEGWLLFSPNELGLGSIPEERAESGVKTPHRRLRDKMYVLWKQKGGKGDFESYYRTSMQKLENIITEQLTP